MGGWLGDRAIRDARMIRGMGESGRRFLRTTSTKCQPTHGCATRYGRQLHRIFFAQVASRVDHYIFLKGHGCLGRTCVPKTDETRVGPVALQLTNWSAGHRSMLKPIEYPTLGYSHQLLVTLQSPWEYHRMVIVFTAPCLISPCLWWSACNLESSSTTRLARGAPLNPSLRSWLRIYRVLDL